MALNVGFARGGACLGLLALSIILQVGTSLAASGPVVNVNPSITQLGAAGGNFSISILVGNVSDLYGFQFELSYNRTAVNATGVSVGPFLTSDGWNQIFTSVLQINNTQGTVTVASSRYGVSNGVSGGGVLANIGFSVQPRGRSVLNLQKVKLGNSRAQLLGDFDGDGFTDNVTGGYVATSPGDIPPFARILVSPAQPVVRQTVNFDGSRSYDLDGSVAAYQWGFGDATNATGSSVTHSYTLAGSYNATLKVTDNQGASGFSWIIVTVSEEDLALVQFSASASNTFPGGNVTLVATVANQGVVPATFGLTAYYNGTLISRLQGLSLGPSTTRDFSVLWVTIGVRFGRYIVSANVTIVPGDATPLDNVMQTTVTVKNPSSLSLAVDQTSLRVGSATTLSGYLSPPLRGETVKISEREESGSWVAITNVLTDATGHYSYVWRGSQPGTYEFQSYWNGDQDHVAAQSPIQSLTLNAQQSLPTFLFILTAGLGGGVFAFFFFRRRHAKQGAGKWGRKSNNWFRRNRKQRVVGGFWQLPKELGENAATENVVTVSAQSWVAKYMVMLWSPL